MALSFKFVLGLSSSALHFHSHTVLELLLPDQRAFAIDNPAREKKVGNLNT